MKLRYYIIGSTLALCLLFQLNARANNASNAIWKQANAFYTSKQYENAIELYTQLLVDKKESAEIYYNLGNAYYRNNEMPQAILNYQRALRLSPNDKNIIHNLKIAQSHIPNSLQKHTPIFFIQWWQGLTKGSLANVWAIAMLVIFVISLASYYLGKINKLPYYKRYIVASVVLLICCSILAINSYQSLTQHNEAVVMTNNTVMLQKPLAAAKVLGGLPAGSTVTILQKKEGFVHITTNTGTKAWIAAKAILVI